MSTFFSDTRPKARKEYSCEWCGEKIIVGEVHIKVVGIWEGDFGWYRLHNECSKAMRYVMHEDEYICEEGFMPHEHARGKKEPERVAARLAGMDDWRY